MNTVDVGVVVDEVLRVLRSLHRDTGSGPRVGDGEAPQDTTYPYAIAYVVPGPGVDGSMGQPQEMATVVVQVSCVGDVRRQAQALAHRFRSALFDRAATGEYSHPIRGAGWKAVDRQIDADGGTSAEGRVHTAIDRYAVTVAPA